MSPRLLLLILVAFSAPALGHAQRVPVRLGPGAARLLWERPSPTLATERAREPLGGLLGRGDLDYRYTGFFVGAGLGLVATAFAFAWCGNTDNACDSGRVLPVGIVVSGLLGLGTAVIGGFIPKARPNSSVSKP